MEQVEFRNNCFENLIEEDTERLARAIFPRKSRSLNLLIEYLRIGSLDEREGSRISQKKKGESKVDWSAAVEQMLDLCQPEVKLPLRRSGRLASQEHYIGNAGLVLLGPFLKRFFEYRGWMMEKQFVSSESQMKAIQALQYIATGEQGQEEHDFLLNKIMCGLPVETPLPLESLLREEDLVSAESLLASLIKNWPALGAVSIAGFRKTFMLREGRLTPIKDGWRLHVNSEVRDILLRRLPWGIGMQIHPWMESTLHVEWS